MSNRTRVSHETSQNESRYESRVRSIAEVVQTGLEGALVVQKKKEIVTVRLLQGLLGILDVVDQ